MSGTNFLAKSSVNPTVYVALINEDGKITDAEIRGTTSLPYEPIFAQQAIIRVLDLNQTYVNSVAPGITPVWDVISTGGGGGGGVTSFKGRTGTVVPALGDYTKSLISDLNQVDNTTDLNKPISTATQTALDLKLDKLMSAGSRLLGRSTAGAGNAEEITLGVGFSMTAGVLNYSAASSGTVTTVSVATANGVSGTVSNPTTTPAITLTLGDITPTSVTSSGLVSGSNLSGINTGDQTITLTGAVTGTGTGSFSTTIPNTSIDLTTKVVGILPVANGGTGSATQVWVDLTTGQTIGGLKTFSIAPRVATFTTAGFVKNDASGNFTTAVSVALTTDVSGILPITNGGTGSATQNYVDLTTGQTIAGLKTFSTPIAISPFTTAGIVKNSAAGIFSSGLVVLTTDVSGILPIANGGTGSATQNFVDLTTAQTIAGVKSFSSDSVHRSGTKTVFNNSANTFATSFSAGAQTVNIDYTLPIVAPTAGQVLSSTAGGVLSWTSVAATQLTATSVTAATYTVVNTDEFLDISTGANAVNITLPSTYPDRKFLTVAYVKTANALTFTAGAGTTIVDPSTYLAGASFIAPGTTGQYGSTRFFKNNSVWQFVG